MTGRAMRGLCACALALLLSALAFAAPASAQTDTTAPTFSSATVDGTSLVITFNEAMNTAGNPASSVFAISVRGGTGTSRGGRGALRRTALGGGRRP